MCERLHRSVICETATQLPALMRKWWDARTSSVSREDRALRVAFEIYCQERVSALPKRTSVHFKGGEVKYVGHGRHDSSRELGLSHDHCIVQNRRVDVRDTPRASAELSFSSTSHRLLASSVSKRTAATLDIHSLLDFLRKRVHSRALMLWKEPRPRVQRCGSIARSASRSFIYQRTLPFDVGRTSAFSLPLPLQMVRLLTKSACPMCRIVLTTWFCLRSQRKINRY